MLKTLSVLQLGISSSHAAEDKSNPQASWNTGVLQQPAHSSQQEPSQQRRLAAPPVPLPARGPQEATVQGGEQSPSATFFFLMTTIWYIHFSQEYSKGYCPKIYLEFINPSHHESTEVKAERRVGRCWYQCNMELEERHLRPKTTVKFRCWRTSTSFMDNLLLSNIHKGSLGTLLVFFLVYLI